MPSPFDRRFQVRLLRRGRRKRTHRQYMQPSIIEGIVINATAAAAGNSATTSPRIIVVTAASPDNSTEPNDTASTRKE